jgi:hypothetical protein
MSLVIIVIDLNCFWCLINYVYSTEVLRCEGNVYYLFFLNCHYCLDGTRSRYYGHAVPTLEEYIPCHEDLLPPPAVDLGEAYNFTH